MTPGGYGNPFLEKSNDLSALDKKLCHPSENYKQLQSVLHEGLEQSQIFNKSCSTLYDTGN